MEKTAALKKAKLAIKLAKQRVLEDIQKIQAAEAFIKNAFDLSDLNPFSEVSKTSDVGSLYQDWQAIRSSDLSKREKQEKAKELIVKLREIDPNATKTMMRINNEVAMLTD